MKMFIVSLALSCLGACGSAQQAQTAPQSIYQIENNYAAALTIAVAYKKLPTCGLVPSLLLCSQPGVIAKLQQADDAAYPLIKAAENVMRKPGAGANADTALRAAQQALEALTAITATLQRSAP